MKWFQQNQQDPISKTVIHRFTADIDSLSIFCVVESVSDEWWCYCYHGHPANDIAPPSTHKTSAAAKKRVLKNVLAWLERQRAEVLK